MQQSITRCKRSSDRKQNSRSHANKVKGHYERNRISKLVNMNNVSEDCNGVYLIILCRPSNQAKVYQT